MIVKREYPYEPVISADSAGSDKESGQPHAEALVQSETGNNLDEYTYSKVAAGRNSGYMLPYATSGYGGYAAGAGRGYGVGSTGYPAATAGIRRSGGYGHSGHGGCCCCDDGGGGGGLLDGLDDTVLLAAAAAAAFLVFTAVTMGRKRKKRSADGFSSSAAAGFSGFFDFLNDDDLGETFFLNSMARDFPKKGRQNLLFIFFSL